MRLIPFIMGAALLVAESATAQGWIRFSSQEDFFSVNIPNEPTVAPTTYTSAQGAPLPGRVYSAEQGQRRFSVTVVDYSPIEAVMLELRKECDPEAHSACVGDTGDDATGPGYAKLDKAGAVDFATWNIIKRGSEITYFAWSFLDFIGGRWMHLTNPDGSRTYYAITMHQDRLYIFEATVPKGEPEPGIFHQSVRFIDDQGEPVRYDYLYHNGYGRPTN